MNMVDWDAACKFGNGFEFELLEAQTQSRVRGRIYDLQVECRDNGVVLKGHSRTYYGKQLAQQAVMEATDLPILANEIEVC